MTGKWGLFALVGVAATATYVGDLSPAANAACFLLVGVGTVVACFAGPLRRRAEPRAGWLMLGAAALSFLVGVLVRPVATEAGVSLLADIATIPGYLLLYTFLGMLLRARQSVERHAVLDGLIVCLAGGLASTLLLAVPAAEVPGRPAAV